MTCHFHHPISTYVIILTKNCIIVYENVPFVFLTTPISLLKKYFLHRRLGYTGVNVIMASLRKSRGQILGWWWGREGNTKEESVPTSTLYLKILRNSEENTFNIKKILTTTPSHHLPARYREFFYADPAAPLFFVLSLFFFL